MKDKKKVYALYMGTKGIEPERNGNAGHAEFGTVLVPNGNGRITVMQQSKQSLIEDNERMRSELDRVHEALAAVMAGDDQLVGQFTLDGQTVKARLIHADRAHGGLIMFTSQCGNSDRPSHRVHYLEEQELTLRHNANTDYSRELRNLVGKASQLRYRMTHPVAESVAEVNAVE